MITPPKKFYRKHKKKVLLVVLAFFIIINTSLYFLLISMKHTEIKGASTSQEAQEITDIKATRDLKIREGLYRKLIQRIGPEDAQVALYKSGLPFDGETHLLNHTVGDYLYAKYGSDGLTHCRDYFLSSCYHGLILKAIGEHGIGILDSMMNKCWSIGYTTATQCAHGIGHGVLAYNGYKNLPKALEQCDTVSQTSPNFPTYNCYDGAFMENLWAVHENGQPSPDRWLKTDDLVYPCDDPQIDEKYRKACWSNQPVWMYQQYRGDLRKVGQECEKLENQNYKVTCFDAIARQINPLSNGDRQSMIQMCSQMPSEHWSDECIYSNVRSSFSVGDRTLPFTTCASLPGSKKLTCYRTLKDMIAVYALDDRDRQSLCRQVYDESVKKECQSMPLNN